ncbi:MAG TPA: hypothetical protein VK308_17340 [Pyrinomonadaceae bacterium]|nr:hypothetical protein [Pyrinomonadaceae bacterium]
MKQTKLFFWIAAITLLTCSPVLADVKIKTRNTVAEQTSESTVYIKGKRQRSEQDFGGMKTVNLTQCDLRRDVQLNTRAKTYFLSLYNSGGTTNQISQDAAQNQKSKNQNQKGGVVTTTVTLKDTGERKQLFGYTARRILSTMVMESSPDACSPTKTKMETDGWYIDAEFAFDCLLNHQYKYQPQTESSGCEDRQEFKQVGSAKLGYPVYLKTTMRGENGSEDFTSIMEVLEISPATLDAALFEIPADYREVKNQADLFKGGFVDMDDSDEDSEDDEKPKKQSMSVSAKSSQTSSNRNVNVAANKPSNSANTIATTPTGAKKAGVVRLGLATVKTGSAGEGMNAEELSESVKNTLAGMFKGANVELVSIEAKLPSAVNAEAKQKSCDFVIYATVSHKKGGGGFGKMLGKIAPVIVNEIPVTSSVEANTAINAGRQAIYTAGDAAQNVKSKDELTLEINLQSGGTSVLSNKFKSKAKSDGEDIISPLVEQVAQAILTAVAGK